jgi:hypothetical protein
MWSLKNLDAWSGGGWGVFIAPTTKPTVGEAVRRWAHRTVRCATGHYPVRQPRHPIVRVLTVLTVRALISWCTGQSGAAPDSPVPHRTGTIHCLVCLLALLWLCANCPHTVHAAGDRWSRPLRFLVVAPLAHRTVRWIIAERLSKNPKVKSSACTVPGAPDTVRWHTGQFGAPDQGSLRFLLLLSFEP